jgi:hypothetical protein
VLAFETLQQLMHALGSGKFNALLYNVLCGNQVIVRGECRPLVASVLALLTVPAATLTATSKPRLPLPS